MHQRNENTSSSIFCARIFPNPEQNKEQVLFIPLDLASEELCIINNLNFEIHRVLYDQPLYNDTYLKVVTALMSEMLNPKLFPHILKEVNPLYVLMPQLVNLFGNAIHKILELAQIIHENREKNVVIITSDSYHGSAKSSFVDLIDYQILLSQYFGYRNDFEMFYSLFKKFPDQKISESRPQSWQDIFKMKVKDFCILFHNQFLARGDANHETAITWQIKNKSKIYSHLKKRHTRPKIFRNFQKHSIERNSNNFVRMKLLLEYLSKQQLKHFDPQLIHSDKFIRFIESVFVSKSDKFFDLYSFVQPNCGDPEIKEKILFCHLTIEIQYRALYYQKYLQGFSLYSQEYSDGDSIGYAKSSSILYVMAPIATRMYFSNSLYHGYEKYIKDQFPSFHFDSYYINQALDTL